MITITIDENSPDNTLLRVYYQKITDNRVSDLIHTLKLFVKDNKKSELIQTGVTLLYITYNKNIVSGEELAIKLYNRLIASDFSDITIDESSSEPEYKWRILKSFKSEVKDK